MIYISEFIARHLSKDVLLDKYTIIENLDDTICKMCGKSIQSGIEVKKVIKHTFTDNSYIRFNSNYLCIDCCCLLSKNLIKEDGSISKLMYYSYICTEQELILLKREDLMQWLLNPPNPPFIFCITYKHKKYTSFKAKINFSQKDLIIQTDIGSVLVNYDKLVLIKNLIQNWYIIVPGQENTSLQPTYFNKGDILYGCNNNKKITDYGLDKYIIENQEISKYRDTTLLQLIVHALNKEKNNENYKQ